MLLSVELTLYPLQDNYLEIIKAVIEKLNSFSEVEVKTYPTATVIVGDYDKTMHVVSDVVRWSYDTYGKCVFIAKFLPEYDARS